jgi:hypothetical protein
MTTPGGDDALQRLRAQVEAAHEAAERVARTAAASGTPREAVPPAGWAAPTDEAPREGTDAPEVRALVALLEIVRELVPADVSDQAMELVRELLLLARAIIDLVVSRLERPRRADAEVEDIPIG